MIRNRSYGDNMKMAVACGLINLPTRTLINVSSEDYHVATALVKAQEECCVLQQVQVAFTFKGWEVFLWCPWIIVLS